MTITERIEAAIKERHRQMMKPTAVVLSPLEAGELFQFLVNQSPWKSDARKFTMTVEDITKVTYNGLPIRLSENDGIDILT